MNNNQHSHPNRNRVVHHGAHPQNPQIVIHNHNPSGPGFFSGGQVIVTHPANQPRVVVTNPQDHISQPSMPNR
jgi:hypothetical protein